MTSAGAQKSIAIPGLGSVTDGSRDAALLGPLLGMAVGDALGTSYEFARMDQPVYPALATGPAVDVVGGGPFNLTAGQITDDTQMAICIARSLVHARPLDLADLAKRYLAWFEHAFDVGNQTASALKTIENGGSVTSAGRQVWHESGRRAAGNGSLMRTAPIGVAFAADGTQRIIEESLADSLLTHADPRCAIACAIFNVAIAHGITHVRGASRATSASAGAASSAAAPTPLDPTPKILPDHGSRGRAMLEAGRAAIPGAVALLRDAWSDNADDLEMITRAEDDLCRDLDTALSETPNVHGNELDILRTAGFVRVAFRLAFWHLVHTPWRDAVIDVASRGGDADTNGAIVGALLGARDGVLAIPGAWIDRVLSVEQPGPPEWAAAHHPRHLVALVEVLRGVS